MRSKVYSSWGVNSEEQNIIYPCDRFIKRFDAIYYRGVTIHATAQIIFRWLCQPKVAPYSYDLLDNFGKRSPRTLTPGMDQLVIGQLIMNKFRLVDFEKDKQVTLLTHEPKSESRHRYFESLFGEIAISYLIVPQGSNACRLLVKIIVQYPAGISGRLMSILLPWGDKVMMRKQLLNLKKLSEGNIQ
jgi:hypothetical protein